MKNRDQLAQDVQPGQSSFKLKLGQIEAELGFSQNIKVGEIFKSKNVREESIFKLCPDFEI